MPAVEEPPVLGAVGGDAEMQAACRTAPASSPTTSRFGPIFAALQSVRLQSYIGKPSWCSATGTTILRARPP